jgi:hypothetical protein
MFSQVTSVLTVIYLLFMGVTMNTKNFTSALIFKIIPMFLAAGMAVVVLKMFGFLI